MVDNAVFILARGEDNKNECVGLVDNELAACICDIGRVSNGLIGTDWERLIFMLLDVDGVDEPLWTGVAVVVCIGVM